MGSENRLHRGEKLSRDVDLDIHVPQFPVAGAVEGDGWNEVAPEAGSGNDPLSPRHWPLVVGNPAHLISAKRLHPLETQGKLGKAHAQPLDIAALSLPKMLLGLSLRSNEGEMPLREDTRKAVLDYCHQDLRPRDWYETVFSFIDDEALRERLGLEYYSARYIYKIGEALFVDGDRLYSHVKYQIVQYASIYEAVIVYLLWSKYSAHPAVTGIEWHTTFKKVAEWPNNICVSASDEDVVLCAERQERTSRISIKFDDKVDAFVQIGCIEAELGEEIKKFFKLRNGMHIENAVKNNLRYELDMAQLAYRRIWAFTKQIRGFITDGVIPKEASLRTAEATATVEETGHGG